MASRELVDGLNVALNREVSTFLRYMLEASMIRGVQWEMVRTMYLSEVQDEVGHAQYLANALARLGETPVLKPDLSPPPKDVREMLARDAEQERVDVEHYMKLARLAERDGLVALKFKMEEQAADEQEHGQEMLRLLG